MSCVVAYAKVTGIELPANFFALADEVRVAIPIAAPHESGYGPVADVV